MCTRAAHSAVCGHDDNEQSEEEGGGGGGKCWPARKQGGKRPRWPVTEQGMVNKVIKYDDELKQTRVTH